MPEDPRTLAAASQLRASDPAVSAFVAASAGSGKTKLLTDRLLRLLLAGADPARIQCLTFTKAAAAEMAVRLQRELGRWVTCDDAALDAALRALDIAPAEPVRRKARALFADVLDLPGGMRIGTIHAFCQSLLRRFPLEARLSPHFRLVDDADAAIALAEARESMLAGVHDEASRDALEKLAGQLSLDGFGKLVERLRSDPARLGAALAQGPDALEARLRRLLRAADPATLPAATAAVPGESALRRVIGALNQSGPPTGRKLAERLDAWLGLDPGTRAEAVSEWQDIFLRADGAARAPGGLVRGRFLTDNPDLAEILLTEQSRLLALADAGRAWQAAALSTALARLAAPVAAAYAGHKQGAGLVDYDDLIRNTSALLDDPGVAWVLYKLDGGLDHLLLDEVQDTAPAQWRIAGRLTEEFFAGAGVAQPEGPPRSVFAVGDRKQSIYSFQGAEPDEFERWRAILQRRVTAAKGEWRDVELQVSFRSTAPVLALVDAVFAAPNAADGVAAPGTLTHLPDRAGHAGAVTIWPLAPLPQAADPEPWAVPATNAALVSAPQRLAEALAAHLAASIGTLPLDSRGRALAPGDVLVLVRRRNAFASALVRALKSRNVPVAGLDRMVLTEQPAVADLLALCDALLLPEDDLSLACLLTSPLGGLGDESLTDLAAYRPPGSSLWHALQSRAAERPEWRRAADLLATLLARVDYAPPHALLSEALGPLGGRARLLARLGPEAAEPVDELLQAALTYAAAHPPSLQGFLHWLRQSAAEVKREPEGAASGAGLVRVMTVHGAKGLQAPLVILPDTTGLPPDDAAFSWQECDGPAPVWAPRKALSCAAIDDLRSAARARVMQEYNRLLYVALTRAEDRLLVCGWEGKKPAPAESWYELVRQGFARLGATPAPFAAWDGEALTHATGQTAEPKSDRPAQADDMPAPLPAWAGAAPDWRPAPPPPEPAVPAHLAPSRPENAGLGPVPAASSPLSDRSLAERDAAGARLRRGQLAHTLLQHLPALPEAARAAAAKGYLARAGLADPDGLAAEVLAVLAHPALAPLFGPSGRAEVPLTGVVGEQVIGGLVDRLAVLDDAVLVADYKTNRAAPARAEDAPVLYLRQMAAYRAVLRQVFPGRAIRCALVWTTSCAVMPLPDSLLDSHAPGQPQPA